MEPMTTTLLSHVATFVTGGNTSGEDHRVSLIVPFNFVVGDQMLPSGTYQVISNRKRPEALSISNQDKKVHILTSGQPVQRDEIKTNEVVFHKYRSLYFLTDIQFANCSVSIHFPATKAEQFMSSEPAVTRERLELFYKNGDQSLPLNA